MPEHDRWVGVIPVRLASTRIPHKALQDVGGFPLVVWCWRSAVRMRCLPRVVVATDSSAIADVLREEGAEVALTGPQPSGTHRVAQAADQLGLHGWGVVNLQGDQPDIGSEAVQSAIEATEDGPIGTVMSALPPDAGPECVRVWHRDGVATDFGRSGLGGDRHIGVYAFRPGALKAAMASGPSLRGQRASLEQLAWLDSGLRIGVRRIASAPTAIDTIPQLDALRARVKAGDLPLPPSAKTLVYAGSASR